METQTFSTLFILQSVQMAKTIVDVVCIANFSSFVPSGQRSFTFVPEGVFVEDSTKLNLLFNGDTSQLAVVVVASYEFYFFEVFRKIISSTQAGYRRWFPIITFQWPVKIYTNFICSTQSREITVRSLIRDHIMPNLQTSIYGVLISDEILLVFYLECKDGSGMWSVWDVYSIIHNSKNALEFNEIFSRSSLACPSLESLVDDLAGNWVTVVPPKLQRRKNFHLVKIRAVAPILKEIKLEVDWKLDKATGQIIFVGGMSVDIIKDFQHLLNFTLDIISGDWFVTGTQPNANISHLKPVTGDLIKLRQVELMIGHTTPIPSRVKSLDILLPSSYNRLWAFVHQPSASSVRDIFVFPFQWQLWIAFLVCWLLILISIKIFIKFQEIVGIPLPAPNNDSDGNDDDDLFASDPLFWSFATITQQGWDPHPKCISFRLLFFLGTLLTVVCFIAYSAAIVSILATEEIPIPNLQALFSSSLQIFAMLESSNVAEVIKGLQTEGKISSRTNPFLSVAIGSKRVFEKPMAYIVYDHVFHVDRERKNISAAEFCSSKITTFPVTKTTTSTCMTMPKNSPLRETFNYGIMFIKERGLLQRHQTKFHLDGGIICLRDQSQYKTLLALDDLFTAPSLLALGSLLSISVFIVERIFLTCTTTTCNNKDIKDRPRSNQN